MDNKISVTYCSVTLAAAAISAVLIMGLIAIGAIPMRFMGVGLICLTTSGALYLRGRINYLLVEREDAAFRLGRASHELERSALHSVQ